MTLFGKRKPPPVKRMKRPSFPGPSQVPAPHPGKTSFPVVDPAQGPKIVSLINEFQAAPTIAGTQGPANGLMRLSGASPIDQSRTLWSWFAAWCNKAREIGQPLVAVRIAEFVQYYEEMYFPNAGSARMFLFKPTDEQRLAIERAAFTACGDLDAAASVRPDIDLPVAAFERYLGERTGQRKFGGPPGASRELAYGDQVPASENGTMHDLIARSEAHRRATAPPGVGMSGGPDDDLHRFVIDIREPGDAPIQVIVQAFIEAANEQDAADRIAQAISARQIRAVQLLAPAMAENTGSDAWWWDGEDVRPWFGLSDEIPTQGTFRVAWSVFVDAPSLADAVRIAFDNHGPAAPEEHLGFLVTDHQGQIWSIWAGIPW